MSGGIYLIGDDGELVELHERGYDSEDLLQGYLARHHDLLAGDQINSTEPRRWLLVSREMPLASEEDGSGRWSVDHLFLDQDAVPTIIETKRSTDTRIRREVVGQMLDYAANGVTYWSVEKLRAQFEANPDSEEKLLDFLQTPDSEPDDFWQKVEGNLQRGRVRLVFVSDKIPEELRRIVEFLNEQMSPAEVLAVEIKHYVSDDSKFRTLVPRVIGQTTKAKDHKSTTATIVRTTRKWDEQSFFDDLRVRFPEAVTSAAQILEWARCREMQIKWGAGSIDGSFTPTFGHSGSKHQMISVYTNGTVEMKFAYMQEKEPFNEREKRVRLKDRLNEIEGVNIPEAHVTDKRPWIYLSHLNNEDSLEHFLTTLDWFVAEVLGT